MQYSLYLKRRYRSEKELVTDANGHISVQVGVWRILFQETKSSKGYVIDPTKREFLLRTPEQLMKMELLLLVQ